MAVLLPNGVALAMKYLICGFAIFCAAAFFSVGLMTQPDESGYAASLPQLAAR